MCVVDLVKWLCVVVRCVVRCVSDTTKRLWLRVACFVLCLVFGRWLLDVVCC